MATLTLNCPHCSANNVSFVAVSGTVNPMNVRQWNLLMQCGACGQGVIAVVDDAGTRQNPTSHPGDLASPVAGSAYRYNVLKVFPRSAPTEIPAHLPDSVAKAFKEGCEVMSRSPSAACAQYRKALELGMKAISPEIEAWKLERRIDKLAMAGKLTPALKEWAHQLRLDGNDALHGDEDPTPELAKETQDLTRFVLMYLYTLPKSVELARPKTNGGDEPSA